MTSRLLVCAVLVTGCLDPDLFAPGPSARLYDNGVKLRVSACPNASFLSCTPPEQFESASISADGTTEALERSTSNAPFDAGDPNAIPAELYDDDANAFALEIASPANPDVTIAIDGRTSGVTEPPPFAVDVQVSRQQVTVDWQPMPNAVDGSTDVFLFSACGSNSSVSETLPSGSAHQVQLDLVAGCTSTVEVAQFAPLAVDGTARVGFTRIVQAPVP
jgi:hypothetical protein